MDICSSAVRRIVTQVVAVVMCVAFSTTAFAQGAAAPRPASDHLTLVVPSAVGGGWDMTAKAMKATLERENIVRSVDIVRYPGAGGLVGLSQFVARYRGRDDVLMIGGLVMLGAALRDESAVGIRDVTPIARITGDWGMLVTSRRSPIQTVEDISKSMTANPEGVRWAGGSLGGPDQGLVWRIAQQLGVPFDEIPYYGRAGGRRVADALVEGRADIGMSGYSEFATFLADKQLRVLAVAAPERIPGIDAPTLRESGIDATMMNWRGVFAAPGLAAAQQDRLSTLVGAMVKSATWQEALRTNHWTNTYLDSAAFAQFIDREQARWLDIVNPPERTTKLTIPASSLRIDSRLLAILATVLAVVTAAAAFLTWRLHRRRASALALELRCRELAGLLDQDKVDPGKLVKDGIDNDFGEWKLSSAEADIAWFMLRGLPLREIATLRGTSERTVRQQAQAIYRKAGLEGRSDLAGRVLERFI